MKSNLNPLSPSGTINRKSFFLTEIILVSISSLLMYMAENQAPYMTNLGRILYIAVIILLSLGMIFAAIKRCREVGISVWWSALLVVPIAYYLVGLGLFGGFVCWFLDIDDNLLLEGLAIFGGFIFMSLVPLGGYAVLAGATYYAAEILDWGWLLAILFVFPGIGFMLLAGAGSLFSVLANKFRASRH